MQPASEPDTQPPLADSATPSGTLYSEEEADLARFQSYVATLEPDALWDVASHLDRDRFPRRLDVVRKEMQRRKLLYFPPYTERELRLRHVFAASTAIVIVASVLCGIGTFPLEPNPSEKLPLFVDLAVAAPEAARRAFHLLRPFALFAGFILAPLFLYCALLAGRRRIRRDLLWLFALLSGIALLLAWRVVL